MTHLLPIPRVLEYGDDLWKLPDEGVIVLNGPELQALRFTAVQLQQALQKTSLTWPLTAGSLSTTAGEALISLNVIPHSMAHAQGYELTITAGQISVVASEAAGVFYGVQTLGQLLEQHGRELPTLRCRDWPDFPNRGVMLDVSRDKVPTMDTLYKLVDLFASWKLNQLQLYTEHTFAYRQHKVVWQDASPITGEEILALDAYCRERFIELVPNQNSFGHMRRWLVHPEYNDLAECPGGCDTIWGYFDEPFTLNPSDPRSLDLVRSLYDELLPHFSSSQFNVGCDETVDLGRGRSKALVEEKGEGRVYFDFLMEIYREVSKRGRTMQFWGDIIVNHPDLVAELPRDVIALEWGYEATHDFDGRAAVFARSGIPFYVCPGTATWNTVGGRTNNALGNLKNAAVNGLKHGAIGYLNTDWGDRGHWQPLPVSYVGFGYGAAVSWAYEANEALDISAAISHFVFQDAHNAMGQLMYELGNAHDHTDMQDFNGTILFRILQATPEEMQNRLKNEDGAVGERLHKTIAAVDGLITRLEETQMQCADAELVEQEFAWAAEMMRHACERALWISTGQPAAERPSLKADAERLIRTYHKIWHSRNRPGGYRESVERLEEMARAYAE